MKDQSSFQAVMSSSFQATEACVSPASIPAECSWLKRTDSRPSRRDSASASDGDTLPIRPVVIRIGEAPCVPASFNGYTGRHDLLPDPRKTMPNGQCSRDLPSAPNPQSCIPSQKGFPSYQSQFVISSYPFPSSRQHEENVFAAAPNQTKTSNLSDIERQRGPIKKRHIPELLDLSTKRAKEEPASSDVVASTRDSTGSSNTDLSKNRKAVRELFQTSLGTLKHEKHLLASTSNFSTTSVSSMQPSKMLTSQNVFTEPLMMAVKQEKCESDGIRYTGPLGLKTGPEDVLPSKIRSREYTLGGDTSLDHKRGATDSSSIGQFGNHLLGSASYLNKSFLRVVPEDIFGHWVLQVTHDNPFTTKRFQVEGVPNLKFSQTAFKSGHRSSETTSCSSLNDSRPSTAEKPYACQHCSSTFKHRHHVVRHMRAHNGERPFHCEHCGAAFARKCVLTNHRRTHTGEKPYICAECGDSFSRKHHLVIHQRTHSGEKPYRCLECGAAFARSHHVNRHRKTHGKKQEERTRAAASTSPHNQRPTMVPIGRPDVPTTHLVELKLDHDSTSSELVESTPKSPQQNPHHENDMGRTIKADRDIKCPAESASLNPTP